MDELIANTSKADAIERAFDRIDDYLAVQAAVGNGSGGLEGVTRLQASVGIGQEGLMTIIERIEKLGSPLAAPSVLLGVIIGLSAAEIDAESRDGESGA